MINTSSGTIHIIQTGLWQGPQKINAIWRKLLDQETVNQDPTI